MDILIPISFLSDALKPNKKEMDLRSTDKTMSKSILRPNGADVFVSYIM